MARTPPASGATDPDTTEAPVTADGSLSDIAAAPTPTEPAAGVEEARPLAGDHTAKLTQLLTDTTRELREVAADNTDPDVTIRLNALADRIDHQAASVQAPTEV